MCHGSAQGRAQPRNLALALPGAVPKGPAPAGESPERAEEPGPAPLRWPQPRGVFLLLSFRVPTSMDQPKVVFPVGPGQPRPPALLEGPRPLMLLTRPAALPAPSRARRPSRLGGPRFTPGPSPAEFQSSLEMFGVLFSGHICMNPEIPFGMYETSTGVTPTDSVRGKSSASLQPFGHLESRCVRADEEQICQFYPRMSHLSPGQRDPYQGDFPSPGVSLESLLSLMWRT